MNYRSTLILAAASLLLVACIPSVYPFFEAEDVTYDPALLGQWVDGREVWTFERAGNEDYYGLSFTDGNESGVMLATLFTLGEHRFLDVRAAEVDFADDEWELVQMSLFPGHLVFHVEAIEPVLRMSLLDYEWLEDFITANPKALEHFGSEDERIVLTGSTRELQRFLLRHVDGGEMFSDYTELMRRTDAR